MVRKKALAQEDFGFHISELFCYAFVIVFSTSNIA